MADESIHIGGPKPSDSYMNIQSIIEAAKMTGANAIHPGYGFLAENYKFVELLNQNNLIFVGPSSDSIAKMGDKLKSKQVAMAAGIRTIPGFDGIIQNVNHCLEIAQIIGYPIMIKASAGGGGRGMRIAHNEKEASEGYELAAAEAQIAFGDNRILLEKHITNPRHIEIQVLGDQLGNAIHLGERECSIQRRHQKIIEEAPSSFLDESTRSLMGSQAVALCKKINYHSAGTVEFLVDSEKNFYFLEMNTRLQVEHPLTECITGIDLVEAMLLVAQGQPLPVSQNDISFKGWAIETRIYAEDPFKNFGTPSTGRIYKYVEPTNVRCDSGVLEGDLISIYYDPLIAKVISHDVDRKSTIQKTINALDSYILRGVTHNIPLLRDVLTREDFQSGEINTEYLNRTYGQDGRKFTRYNLTLEEKQALIANGVAMFTKEEVRRRFHQGPTINDSESIKVVIELPGGNDQNRNQYHVLIRNIEKIKNTEEFSLELKIDDNDWFGYSISTQGLIINGPTDIVMQFAYKKPDGVGIIFKGALYDLKILSKVAHDLMQYVTTKSTHSISKEVRAPMPGLMKNILCKEGQVVHDGEVLCIIEAMKMQNSMNASTAGRIKKINFSIGDRIAEDDVLIEIE
ncbi:propionyl-CoA carboxylase alpha chain, mitochondrial-like isoform X2 [Atheta coriaria]